MDKIKQIAIIFGVTWLSEVLYRVFHLPVPTGVYGLVLLFLALQTKRLKLEQIEEVGNFLLVAMPIFFIAPGVNLMNIFHEVQPILWKSLVLIFVSTIVVTVVTGKVADFILGKE